MTDKISIQAVCDILIARKTARANLLTVMPWNKAAVVNFVVKHRSEIEEQLGRKLRIERSDYVPTGRGAFGRATGRREGVASRKSGIYWA